MPDWVFKTVVSCTGSQAAAFCTNGLSTWIPGREIISDDFVFLSVGYCSSSKPRLARGWGFFCFQSCRTDGTVWIFHLPRTEPTCESLIQVFPQYCHLYSGWKHKWQFVCKKIFTDLIIKIIGFNNVMWTEVLLISVWWSLLLRIIIKLLIS